MSNKTRKILVSVMAGLLALLMIVPTILSIIGGL